MTKLNPQSLVYDLRRTSKIQIIWQRMPARRGHCMPADRQGNFNDLPPLGTPTSPGWLSTNLHGSISEAVEASKKVCIFFLLSRMCSQYFVTTIDSTLRSFTWKTSLTRSKHERCKSSGGGAGTLVTICHLSTSTGD
jgi:hypothetical protein